MTLKTAYLLHWSSLMSYVLFIADTSKVDELLRITTFKLQEMVKEYIFSSPGSKWANLPDMFTVPAHTVAPTSFSSGIDSPVRLLSSTEHFPDTTSPSMGTISPAFTESKLPTFTSSTCTHSPLSKRTALRGAKSTIAANAARACTHSQHHSLKVLRPGFL